MTQSPLDEFNQMNEDKRPPNEEPVHSIHRIFVFASNVVFRNFSTVIPFVLICLFINLSAEAYFKSILLSLNVDINDLMFLLQNGGGTIVDQINDVSLKLISVNLITAAFTAMIYTNVAAYIAVGESRKGHNNFQRISSFIVLNFLILSLLIILKYLIVSIGFTLFIIPGLMAFLYLLFANFVFIFERKSILECMAKSAELMDGVKVNFLTFISYAFFVFVPVWILNAISGGSMHLVSYVISEIPAQFSITKFIIASISVILREFIWLTYATGVCLLYLKRSKD